VLVSSVQIRLSKETYRRNQHNIQRDLLNYKRDLNLQTYRRGGGTWRAAQNGCLLHPTTSRNKRDLQKRPRSIDLQKRHRHMTCSIQWIPVVAHKSRNKRDLQKRPAAETTKMTKETLKFTKETLKFEKETCERDLQKRRRSTWRGALNGADLNGHSTPLL